MFTLRAALAADTESIQALNQIHNPHPWSSKLVSDALAERQNWVLLNGENVVGWLTCSKLFDQSELELILTHHDIRGQGGGAQLMAIWISWAKEQKVSECLLEVRESNFGAIHLYKKFGFESVGFRKNYYSTEDGGYEHALLMNLTLNYED
ncbi:ribosomal protein S18-alanine N-acetyltransferase [Maribrevibacterium harenarium]|nr:ribosomal protein S18-alanine N-acetyltransferase [Maribrevibacterium harenarium]